LRKRDGTREWGKAALKRKSKKEKGKRIEKNLERPQKVTL
jgi:hypothetical protein